MTKLFPLLIIVFIFSVIILLFLQRSYLKSSNAIPSKEYLVNLFDNLDRQVNHGKGYSEFANNKGFPTGAILAWSESYLLQSYANMYIATKQEKYLIKMKDQIHSILNNRDDKIGRVYDGNLLPVWGSDRYNKDEKWQHYAVHTGMIVYPMLEFVFIVKQNNLLEFADDSKVFLSDGLESIDFYSKYWENDHYFSTDGSVLPANQQAALGRCLIMLFKITGEKQYFEKSVKLAGFLKDNALKEIEGRIVIIDNLKSTRKIKGSDISHAAITAHFIYLAHKNNIVFNDDDDLCNLSNTLRDLGIQNDGRFPFYLDGRGKFDCEVSVGQLFFLTEFDKSLENLMLGLYFEHLKIDQTAKYFQEDWWGESMLGLSSMTRYLYSN